jgi:uncharacterized protein (TIGR02001 family)
MKHVFCTSVASALVFAATTPVLAQTSTDSAPAVSPFTTNVTLTSQYMSRGFRQTWGKPALQGGFDYAGPNGFSAGTWLSNVSNRFVENATLEWDIYGNYGGTTGDVGYNVGAYYYKYPGAEIRATRTTYDYGELAFGLTYKFVYAKYNYTFTKEFFGIENARGTGYLDLGANVELGDGYTLNLHFGHGRVANNSLWSWRDYKAGVTKVLAPGWAVSAAYTKARGKTSAYDNYTLGIPNSAGVIERSNPADATLVFALTRTF